MLYISDFYVAKKEAISNQIDVLRNSTGSFLFAASIFMNQPKLHFKDILGKKVILPKLMYNVFLPLVCLFYNKGIHYYEEEPSSFKRFCFNLSKSKLYISMYRKPNKEYAEHLKGYVNLSKIFVEMNSHKTILVDNGIPESKIIAIPPPSFFTSMPNVTRVFNSDEINIVFASWNAGDYQSLYERGLIYLLDLARFNNNIRLKIILRDNDTELFNKLCDIKEVSTRVELIEIKDKLHLKKVFINSDFVAFTPQIKVTKDIPNSVIDGFKFGKPCIISEIPDYSNEVKAKHLGICKKVGEIFDLNKLRSDEYNLLVMNVLSESKKFTVEKYLSILNHYTEKNEDINL